MIAFHAAHNGCPDAAASAWEGGARLVSFSVPAPPLPAPARRALGGDRIPVLESQTVTWKGDGGFEVAGDPVLDGRGVRALRARAAVVATPAGAGCVLTSTIHVTAAGLPRLLAAPVEAAAAGAAAAAASAFVAWCADAGAAAARAPPPPGPLTVTVDGKPIAGGDAGDGGFADAASFLAPSQADAADLLACLDRLAQRAADLAADVRVARAIVREACPGADPVAARAARFARSPEGGAWCAAAAASVAACVAVVALRAGRA